MKKTLLALFVAGFMGLSAQQASAGCCGFGNDGPWDDNDWPEWTPMYWMEEFADEFDDDDDYYGPPPWAYAGYPPPRLITVRHLPMGHRQGTDHPGVMRPRQHRRATRRHPLHRVMPPLRLPPALVPGPCPHRHRPVTHRLHANALHQKARHSGGLFDCEAVS
ncbi:hypothetical protein SAMN05443662_0148 [Sulfurivirga caldicuralii]|uniref:Secreted protein n=1 Tax=Sulfurivirga caldicuralii TaxID=364032 RepID=A0A1N6DHD5_9GAMM|nr:hypothetical protein SAMN05443662_0148 [Sulfurivirga caldicuralii]